MNLNLSPKLLTIVQTVAPTLATALGGPLAGIAAKAITDALTTTGKPPAATEAALAGATPDQLLALSKAEKDFLVQMEQLGVQREQLEFADAASARAREIAVKDWTPEVLAYGTTIGFFGILGWMLVHGVPRESDVLMVMLGSLGTAWTAMTGYYFGSSVGARKNGETLAKIAQQP